MLTSNESMKEFPKTTKNLVKDASVESIGVSKKILKYATSVKGAQRPDSRKEIQENKK